MNSLQNFKTYQLAKALYKDCQKTKINSTGMRDQLLRAASSVGAHTYRLMQATRNQSSP